MKDGISTLAKAPSWYQTTATPFPELPPLDGDQSCDVVILGGGFTGLTTALELTARGYSCVVLEGDRVGNGASGRNGGQICSGYNPEMGTLVRWFGHDRAMSLWEMAEEAKGIVRDNVERYAIDCDLRWGYLLAGVKARHDRALREHEEELHAYGATGVRYLDRLEIGSWVETERYTSGLYDPTAGQLHPLNYCLGLARAALAAGVRIYEQTEVIRVETGASPAAVTARGTVRGKYMVLGGNALFRQVPQMASRIMPVGTYIVSTTPMAPERAEKLIRDRAAVADINFVLNYYRLSPDNRMLFGGRVSYSGMDAPGLRTTMRRTMLHYFPQLADLEIEHCWGGYVDISMNRLPHLGRLGPNTFFAQGFSGHGVALTGLAGRLMAEAIAGTAERFDVFARIPHRPFPGGPLRTPALVLAMLWYRLRDML